MAIDVFSEKVVSLTEATRLLPKSPKNKKLHVSTLYRWAIGGLRSKDGMIVCLETVKVGGTTCTSQEALQRFFDRLSGDTTVVTPPTLTRRQRLRELEQVDEELRRAGL
jgi:hypothetical protein